MTTIIKLKIQNLLHLNSKTPEKNPKPLKTLFTTATLLIIALSAANAQTQWLEENFSSPGTWGLTVTGPYLSSDDISEASIDTGYFYIETLQDQECPEAQGNNEYSGLNTPSGDYSFELHFFLHEMYQTGTASAMLIYQHHNMDFVFTIPDNDTLRGELVLRKCDNTLQAYLNGNLLSYSPMLSSNPQGANAYFQFYTLACGLGTDNRAVIVIDRFTLQECGSASINENHLPPITLINSPELLMLIAEQNIHFQLYDFAGRLLTKGSATKKQNVQLHTTAPAILVVTDEKGKIFSQKIVR